MTLSHCEMFSSIALKARPIQNEEAQVGEKRQRCVYIFRPPTQYRRVHELVAGWLRLSGGRHSQPRPLRAHIFLKSRSAPLLLYARRTDHQHHALPDELLPAVLPGVLSYTLREIIIVQSTLQVNVIQLLRCFLSTLELLCLCRLMRSGRLFWKDAAFLSLIGYESVVSKLP